MKKGIAYFMALCLMIMGIVVFVPSAEAQDIAVNIRTHHYDGTTYTNDNYFREEYDFGTPDGFDNVYFSFFASSWTGGAYVGNLFVEIVDPSTTPVWSQLVTLGVGDNGIYQSWNDGYYWEIDPGDPLGTYTLNIWNATAIIGTKDFEVYQPSNWISTIEFFEDAAHTIPNSWYPLDTMVYFTVHMEDEHGGPLYYEYEWQSAEAWVVQASNEWWVDTLWFDVNYDGDDSGSFWVSSPTYQEDITYTLKMEYPAGTDRTVTNQFHVYKPNYRADIMTWTDWTYTTETLIYQTYSWVYWSAHIEDQKGRNLPTGEGVYLQIEHDGDTPRYYAGTVDSEGNITDNFYLGSYWSGDDQIGVYTLRVGEYDFGYLDLYQLSVDFEVMSIKITPEKVNYAQGESINITITTSIYDDDINVTISNVTWWEAVSWLDQSMESKVWKKTYTLADSLPDDTYYLWVNESSTGRTLGVLSFNVKKYTLKVWPDADAYLPGETMTVYYTVTSNRDGAGVSGTTIEWEFEYYDTEDSAWKNPDDDFAGGASGSFNISIQKVASKTMDARLHVWANESGHSDYQYNYIDLGSITINIIDTDSNEYLPGDFIKVYIEALIDWNSNAPVRNGDVVLKLFKADTELSSYNGLSTDAMGELDFIFMLDSGLDIGTYKVVGNVTKDGTDEYDESEESFDVVEKREMSLVMEFDRPQYYSGDTMTVTCQVFRGEEVVTPVNYEYVIYDDWPDYYLAVGLSDTGTFTFDIPDDFTGSLRVDVKATDSEGKSVSTSKSLSVSLAGIILQPNMNNYLPGDVIKVSYEVVGTVPENPQYYYEIQDSNGVLIKRESLETGVGKIAFEVPEAPVPSYYRFTCFVADEDGNVIATETEYVYKLTGYVVTFTLDKNTYKPGETATLKYEITAVDDSELPEEFTLDYGFSGGPTHSIETSKTKGSLKVKVPDYASDGEGYFYISSGGAPTAMQEANVRANPNPLAETAGDMSVLELILLVLLIITLLIALAAWSMGKKAQKEAKLPPWKKTQPLPEPEQFKKPELGPGEEPPEEEMPPPSDDLGT